MPTHARPSLRSKILPLLWGLLAIAVRAAGAESGFPVAAMLGGQRVATSVDSEMAKYYLEQYLEGRRLRPDFDQAIANALEELRPEASDAEALRKLASRFSTDFAAIHFVARLYAAPVNRRAQDRFHAVLERRPPPPAHGSHT